MSFLAAIKNGLQALLDSTKITLSVVVGILISSFIIVMPLWYLGTKHRLLFNILIAAVTGCSILWICGRVIIGSYKKHANLPQFLQKAVWPFFIRALVVLFPILELYFVLLLFQKSGLFLALVVFLIATPIWGGLLHYKNQI